jgi:glycosyltransferase involved in cell wall biosynthesis
MQPLRIGVNALYLIPGGVGGTEIYLRNLLRAMAAMDSTNVWYVFTNIETSPDLTPMARNFVQVSLGVRAVHRPMRLLWEQTGLPFHARKLGLDCLLNPGFTAPVLSPCPNVTVFHDLQHKRHPEHFRWFDLPAWNVFLWASVRRSKVLIADSEATRSDLIQYYRVPEERIRIALLGVEDEFFSIADWRGPAEPYLLCVSTLHPHKNIERLLRVFARFRETRPEFDLVLAGLRGFRTAAIEKLIVELGLEQSVRITGWIPRQDLYDLYRHASAFVYPSTFEGFGLPVLEAMAAGVPLACSNIDPLRAIVQNTAILFDPHNDDDMLRSLNKVVGGMDTGPARERAREFTWARCARETLSAIGAAVAERG